LSTSVVSFEGGLSHFSLTPLSCVTFTESWGRSRKAPMPPVAEPAGRLMPRRNWGESEMVNVRDGMGSVAEKGRAWMVDLELGCVI
jgi:hypothetical protein